MPTISLRRRLLNEINESSKRARLDLEIQELICEILQDDDSDAPSDSTSISSLSSLSSNTDTDSTDDLDLQI